MRIAHIPKLSDDVATAGRWMSAVFTAIGVVALTILAARCSGWIGGIMAAVLLTCNPLIFELAHYFKEDSALLMGIAVSFLALDYFWRTPTPKTAIFLGLGCALAISGKYLGGVILLFVLPPLLVRCRSGKSTLFGHYVIGLILPLCIINLPIILNLHDFLQGFDREIAGATEGHRGVTREVPHSYYFGRLNELTPWGLWTGLVIAAVFVMTRFRRLSLSQWLTLGFPLFFLGLLTFSPKTAGRYLLPVESFLVFTVAVGLAGCWLRARGVMWKAASILAFLAALISSAHLCSGYFQEFSRDTRSGLRLWITSHTPKDAIFAQDGRVDLAADPDWKSPRLLSAEYVADLGSLEELRQLGVTHVIVARQVYNRFINENLKPSPREKSDFDRRALFYRELFAHQQKVWESPLGKVVYLHPGLRVYALGAP